MTDGRQRQPASDEAPHAIPEDASVLATPRQRAMPEPSHLESKESQRRVVHGHSVIPEVSTHHRLQPFALFGKDRKSTRLNSSHGYISYAVFCLKKKKTPHIARHRCTSCCSASIMIPVFPFGN